MSHTPLSFEALEDVYERLAQAIDAAGDDKASLMLTKLALLLARETGDLDAVRAAIEAAGRDL